MITDSLGISSLDNSLVAAHAREVINCCNLEDGFIYFANKFAKNQYPVYQSHDITLHGFQEDYLRHIHANRMSISKLPRQMGKSLCMAIYIAWRLIF